MYQNHVIDPTFFYDAIEEFSFDYDLYVVSAESIDASGKVVKSFSSQKIRGSLQSKGVSIEQAKTGNITTQTYEFYCKSLYRLNIGDILVYKDRYLMVKYVQDYDEYGVRSASLNMIQLYQYKDLLEYVKYLQGEELV